MLHDNMTISRLMVYARMVDEARIKTKSRDAKRARSYDEGFSTNRLEIQDKARLKKWIFHQVPSKFPKSSGDMVSNLKLKKGKGANSPNEKPTSGMFGKKHYGDCIKGTKLLRLW